ncbi:hypothetical protein [uncultured Dokdonia sp.]|uniref:hypothetical protein n=1 Tax=uncultured Dokdonia sp. TaxID=575653 RepID=UPI00260A9B53|nr:hypothetical protein [uncultured Dokdonia sp.]
MNANYKISSLRLFIVFVFLVLFVISFAACKQRKNTKNEVIPSSKTSIQKESIHPGYDSTQIAYLGDLFEKAMIDAQNPTPEERYEDLLPIEGNPNLIDTLIKGERYIQVVSWKSNPDNYSQKGIDSTQGYDIWVTLAPIIKDSCRSFFKTQKDPIMRLRQLLGLQPFTEETFFLELWVKPEDLYRPCPDNGTDDTVCELNVPSDITEEYRTWFNHTRAVQYNDCTDTEFKEYGYPWTQLGYTYDWSPDNPSNIGLSEFVIRRHRYMYVRGKHKTEVYCTE